MNVFFSVPLFYDVIVSSEITQHLTRVFKNYFKKKYTYPSKCQNNKRKKNCFPRL